MRGVHTEVQTKVISKRDIKMGVVTNGDTQNFMKTKTILKSDFGRQNERPKICPYFSLGSVKLNTELASVRVYVHAHYTPEPSGKSIIIARHPCLCARTKTYEAVNRAANTPAH